jgi:uncharacterized membrane protein
MRLKINKYIVYFFIFLLAFAVRIYKIDAFGIWFDEKESLSCALGIKSFQSKSNAVFFNSLIANENTLRNVVKSTILDNGNALLYNISLHFWIKQFGPSDLSIRLPSLIVGLLLILLSIKFSDFLFNDRYVNITVGFFAAFNPILVYTSQVARGYGFAALFSLCATYCLLRIIKINKSGNSFIWFLLYGISILLSLLSHYLTVYVFFIHGIVFLYLLLVKIHELAIKLLLTYVFVALFFCVWLLNGGIEGKKNMDEANKLAQNLAKNWKEGDDMWCAPMSHSMVIIGSTQVLLPLFGNYLQNWGFRIRQIAVLLLMPLCLAFMAFKYAHYKHNKYIYLLFIFIASYILYITYLAYSSGHIIPYRTWYTGFLAPYAIMLISFPVIIIKESFGKNIKLLVVLLISVQLIISIVSCIPYYVGDGKREVNPYDDTANKLITLYQDYDTIIYNNWRDAVLTNIYLVGHNNIIQTVDSTLNDSKVWLKRENGLLVELTDLQDKRY